MKTFQFAVVLGALMLAPPLVHGGAADQLHVHDHSHPTKERLGQGQATGSAGMVVPPLRILMPSDGARVGKQLAMIFETSGDMRRLTMSSQTVRTHLHVEVDSKSLMPSNEQLIRLGHHRYLFVFDLPVNIGPHTLKVYWSDGAHRPIVSTLQKVSVMVEDGVQP